MWSTALLLRPTYWFAQGRYKENCCSCNWRPLLQVSVCMYSKKIENIKTEIKGFENHFMSAFQADVECTVLLKLRRTGYYMSYRETLLLMNMEYIHLTATVMLFKFTSENFTWLQENLGRHINLQHDFLFRPGPAARSEQVTWGFAPWGLADLQGQDTTSLVNLFVACLSSWGKGFKQNLERCHFLYKICIRRHLCRFISWELGFSSFIYQLLSTG